MTILREIAQKLNTHEALKVFTDEPMARRFSFKIGGKTPVLVEPENENALLFTLNLLLENNVPYFILGGGTNIVFGDNGFDGVVISTDKLNGIDEIPLVSREFSAYKNSPVNLETGGPKHILKCGCGTAVNTIVNYAVKNGFTGIEAFCGLPGTVGGGCYMNARCFDLEMSMVTGAVEYLEKVESADSGSARYEKRRKIFTKDNWAYKISPFTDTDSVVTSVEIIVSKAAVQDWDKIKENAAQFMKFRVDKGHFKYPCAGSVFKNNHDFGKPTGVIVDECGLKGLAYGGAQVAPWHGNIIINTENASAADVKTLVQMVKDKVKAATGFDLECEILFYGN